MSKTWIIELVFNHEGVSYYKFTGTFKGAEKAAFKIKRKRFADDYSVYSLKEWIKDLPEL